MQFDIVRGRIRKPEQTNQLVDVVTKYMKASDSEGTLYIGYPLTANRDRAVTIDALLVTKSKGMIAFIYGDNTQEVEVIKEQQDELYFHLDFYLKNYSSLRQGRSLAFTPIVITIFPQEVSIEDENYILVENEEIGRAIENLEDFDATLYKKLCEIIQKVSEIKPRKKRNNVKNDNSYGGIIKKIESEIANLDQWQKKAAFEIPEGPQRIRGLAGSGKTIVLALKAAYLHTQYPDMKIAVTYYTRALYQQYVNLISDFVKELSGEKVDWEYIHVIHAWGSNSDVGIYSKIAKELNQTPYNLTAAINKFGRNNAFMSSCNELLTFIDEDFKPYYDTILIDEAQDMPSPFFRLIFEYIKEPKRIIWAYDELQNLSVVEMPSLEEMFGKDATGSLNISIDNVDGEPKKDIILPICYRNPPWTLALAHSLGFGINHTPILQMFDSLGVWKDIGYTIKTGELTPGKSVTLVRKNSATPKYFEELLKPTDSVLFDAFVDKEMQYKWIAEQIHKNITVDELDPDDILVIFPDTIYTKKEYSEFVKYLSKWNIGSILAGVTTDRDTFRQDDCITCSQIYRAKGNEASMVYIVNADFCATGMELIKLRNILFTAITRSRAWVRITGVGELMKELINEIEICTKKDYELNFIVPTADEMAKTRRLNRERTQKEKQSVLKAKSSISELIEQMERGEVDPELIPEINTLINIIKKRN